VRLAIAGDAALVGQCLGNGFTDGDAGILGRVMLVDMQVARRLQIDVDQ